MVHKPGDAIDPSGGGDAGTPARYHQWGESMTPEELGAVHVITRIGKTKPQAG